MAAEGTPFRGFLYCGLMLTASGPQVIEFNCRFGDPEAQVVLPMIAEPLAALMLAGATGGALPAECRVEASPHVGVVLAASGYPGTVTTGQRIDGLDRVATECPDVHVFHGGVAASGRRTGHRGRPRAHGGRPRRNPRGSDRRARTQR